MKQMLPSNAYCQLKTFIPNDPLTQYLLLRKFNPSSKMMLKQNNIEKN